MLYHYIPSLVLFPTFVQNLSKLKTVNTGPTFRKKHLFLTKSFNNSKNKKQQQKAATKRSHQSSQDRRTRGFLQNSHSIKIVPASESDSNMEKPHLSTNICLLNIVNKENCFYIRISIHLTVILN